MQLSGALCRFISQRTQGRSTQSLHTNYISPGARGPEGSRDATDGSGAPGLCHRGPRKPFLLCQHLKPPREQHGFGTAIYRKHTCQPIFTMIFTMGFLTQNKC